MFEKLHPVTISERAALEIQHIRQTKNIPVEYGLRIGIKGAGCGGVSPLIGFDKKRDSDLAYNIHNIDVFVDKRHTLYIMGKEVDFFEGDDTRGFLLRDPNQDLGPDIIPS
jgi:iron-sulfur cluster assembly protein